MKKFDLLLLAAVFLIAAFFRFYNLSDIPAGFHEDEAIIADNANFILHTGRDTNNAFLPLQTEVFGDYNPTGYVYLAILPIKFFGLTEFATRLPGALLGSLTALVVFFLIYVLLERKSVAVLGGVLFAVSPWDVVLSRSSEQAGAAMFFIVLGFTLLIYCVRKESVMYLTAAVATLVLSYFMYFTPRFFVPLLFMTFFIPWKYWWKRRDKMFVRLFTASFIFLSITSAVLVLGTDGGSSRFNQVSIFGFPGTKLVQEEQIREDGVLNTSVLATRIFHNKVLAYGYMYVTNYLQYFSPEFLFMKGGLPIWLQVPQMGIVYLIELPFILFGIYRIFIEKKKWSYLLFAWLLLAPAAAAFTVDDTPNVRRALFMVPIIEAFAAYGIVSFFVAIPKRMRAIFAGSVVLLFLFSSAYFVHAYSIHAKIHQNWYRSVGFDKMIMEVKKVYNEYEHIIITKNTGGNYSEVLFYMNYDPAAYLAEGATKDASYTGFGKIFFVPGACPATNGDNKIPKGKKLYVESGVCKDVNSKVRVKQVYINRPDGTPAFHLVYE